MKSDNDIWIVDSFTDQAFKGNPAAVHWTNSELSCDRMQAIASELNLSETAFIRELPSATRFSIRYFSPKMEIPLCGHATLASARIALEQLDSDQVFFETAEQLELIVNQCGELLEMQFPVYSLIDADAPRPLLDALGVGRVNYAGYNKETNILMLELVDCEELVALSPDFSALLNSHEHISGVCVTAKANDDFDFYSRYFWPWSGGQEDPVTGGTHTFLANYWAEKLGRARLRSFQASARSGQLEVELISSNMLLIRGQATLVLEGQLRV